MSRNMEFTCDRCGAQFDGDTGGFSLTLGRKEACRQLGLDGVDGFRYDLCDSCAAYAKDVVKRALVMDGRAE